MTKIIIFVEYFLINQKGKLNNKKNRILQTRFLYVSKKNVMLFLQDASLSQFS